MDFKKTAASSELDGPKEDAVERQLRVLFIWGGAVGIGGTETRMSETAAELTRGGHSVISFMRAREPSKLFDLLSTSCTRVVRSKSWFDLWRLWPETRPDIVIAFGLKPSLATRVMRKMGRSAGIVAMARNGLDFRWRPWMHVADRWTSSLVDLYLANSWQVRSHLINKGIAQSKVEVLSSAVGPEWLIPISPRSGRRVVAMVGNARSEKNQLLGVKAFQMASPDATLRIFTDDGTLIRNFLELSRQPSRNEQIEIIEDHIVVPADLDEVDVLLHTSLSESLPRTVLEARARGCFVISSDVGDTARHLDETGGQVVSGFRVEDYASALTAALDRPQRLATDVQQNLRDTRSYVVELLGVCGYHEGLVHGAGR